LQQTTDLPKYAVFLRAEESSYVVGFYGDVWFLGERGIFGVNGLF
jgi:hypothetical protein